MAAVYTDSSRPEAAKSKVKSIIRMKGCDIFRHISKGYGVVINPGFDVGLELLPEGVPNIVSST